MTPDVNVVLIDFKTSKGKEMVTVNEDGSYTILINARLSNEGQLKAYQHAMEHIKKNDFEKEDVQKIEFDAHSNTIKESMPAREFAEKLRALQAERKRLQRRIKQDQERVRFLSEHYDMYALAEHHYLYGNNL